MPEIMGAALLGRFNNRGLKDKKIIVERLRLYLPVRLFLIKIFFYTAKLSIPQTLYGPVRSSTAQ
jgi:hypothetical protein